jgi:diguanylate cyclase (GGDEF)-like protein
MNTLPGIDDFETGDRGLDRVYHYDALTGLPNRTLLGDRLQQAMSHSARRGELLAMVRVDLNGLEEINALHGHDAGDLMLVQVASAMKAALREGDTLARLGGDEFVALLLDLPNLEACVPLVERLMEAASTPLWDGKLSYQVSASVGVAFYPQIDDVDADRLLQQAGQAMGEAKQTGLNAYKFFDLAVESDLRSRQESLGRIAEALLKDEFVLHYQPVVNMSAGQTVGVEALIRWQHPERGLLPPTAFLPAIEGDPLALRLGEWVIDAALAQMEKWLEDGLDLPVSVNVGLQQLRGMGFANLVATLLARHRRIDPSHLQLEIKETGGLKDVAELTKVLANCREAGVSVALDNFGAGNSSLNDIKSSPAAVLKIDQSLVRDILDHPDELSILEGVLGLAAAFHRQSVAEGVENAEQGLMLIQMGCELGQGYGIAHPMPAGEVPGWIASWRPDPRWSTALIAGLDERPLIYAAVEHRAWVTTIEALLKGESDVLPRLSRHQCQFGMWMEVEGKARCGCKPAFQSIEALHWRIHAIGTGVLKLQAQGKNAEGLARIDELHGLVNKMAEQLEAFRQRG